MSIGKAATNDEAESVLGSATRNIQNFSCIHISAAGAVSSIRRNRFMDRTLNDSDDAAGMIPLGMFHQLSEQLREAVIHVALEDAPATRRRNNQDLQLQATARRKKTELLKKKGLMKATAEYAEAVFYHDLYSSAACWKGDPSIVSHNIEKLTTKKSKYDALKTNILIRVKGFGWEWCKHPWSKDGRLFTIEELSTHLVSILIREQGEIIPSEPVVCIPRRQEMPLLGMPTAEIAELDEKYHEGEIEIKRNAAIIRREKNKQRSGEKSIYHASQPYLRPSLEDLVGQRIDVLCKFVDESRKSCNNVDADIDADLIWCQGIVTKVTNEKKKEVSVIWDGVKDDDGKEVAYAPSTIILLPSKWNKDTAGAWRMDIAIDVSEEVEDPAAVEDISGIDIDEDLHNLEDEQSSNIHDDDGDVDEVSDSEYYDSE